MDKYKYLENIENNKTKKYYIKKNKEANIYFNKINKKDLNSAIYDAIKINFRSLPIERREMIFWKESNSKNNSTKIYIKYKNKKKKVLIDLNKIQGNFYSFYVSKQGHIIAYLTSDGGLETYNMYLIDNYGNRIEDKLTDIYEFLEWNSDDTGFYYNRKTFISGDKRNYSSFKFEIYFHKLKTKQDFDTKILVNGEEFRNTPYAYMSVSENSKYILIGDYNGIEEYINIIDNKTSQKIYTLRLKNQNSNNDNIYTFFKEDTLYIYTNEENEFGEIRSIKLTKDRSHIEEEIIIKPQKFLLDKYYCAKDYIYCIYLQNLSHIIVIYDYNGKKIRTIKFKDSGSIDLSINNISNNIYIYYSSFTIPGTIYKYIFNKNKLEKIYQIPVKSTFNPINYKTKYILAKNREGISIPIFITYHKNTNLKIVSPALLKVYGGFGLNYSLPSYTPRVLPFLNDGGIYITAAIRGGGELGPKWHSIAKGSKGKIKTFQDFEDITKFLIYKKYTDSNHLAIIGTSYGGLVVTNAMVRNPSYYKCVIADVPKTDVINSKNFGSGNITIDEYGDPEKKSDLKYILKWSPYQNIKTGVKYPNILIIGSTNDTRVGLMNSLKFSKKLEENLYNNVILLVQENIGHFSDNNLYKQYYIFNYIYKQLRIK